ncbi:MAG: hypothetical protein JWL83_4223 [Actinomycetia bacterium]|nr:hypothetical protein [Actinomycetes bacterium]
MTGLVSGFGAPLLYIAFLNRHGPGDICRHYANGGESCTQESSPWPWLAIGAAFVIAGAVLFVQQHHHRSPARW